MPRRTAGRPALRAPRNGDRPAPAHGGSGEVRIIAGQWRGRRLPVPDVPGLRPTADRVRETLFNWLQPVIPGARCLDLFAGSGALGLEAASRGAAEVVMIERTPAVVRTLRANLLTLGASPGVQVIEGDALAWLAAAPPRAFDPKPFDLALLDPPFADDLLGASCRLLATAGWLAPGARVYLEAPAYAPYPALPAGWELVREGRTRQVRYALVAVAGETVPVP